MKNKNLILKFVGQNLANNNYIGPKGRIESVTGNLHL